MRIAAASVLTLLVFVVADAADAAPRPRLKAFDDCRSLVDYARAGALRTQGGVGVDGRAAPPMVDAVVTPQIVPPRSSGRRTTPRRRAGAGVGAGGGGRGGRRHRSRTSPAPTCRRLGVDEPDILKTDGRRIFAVTDRTLRVVDAASGQVTGTLALDGFGHRLLLRGDRAARGRVEGRDGRLARGQPARRADDRARLEHDDRHRARRLRGHAEGDAHDGGARAGSSTRARTAPPRGS